MALIKVSNLTFSYEDVYDMIFDNTSFMLDTDWRLGFIGRNGKGKTTFLNLLMGKYSYGGSIQTSVQFDYFPFPVKEMQDITLRVMKQLIAPFEEWEDEMEQCLRNGSEEALERYGQIQELYLQHDGFTIEDVIKVELGKLEVAADVLERKFSTLSNGERTKTMLVALFLKKNRFLLIDEPTNHLDVEGRKLLGKYLNGKKGFILVSHDRTFLNTCIDHVLSINKATITVMRGNYDTWKQQKELEDQYEKDRNEKLKKEIGHLKEAKERTASWSEQVEGSKIGSHSPDRGRVGHLAAKMMKRSKSIEKRQNDSIDKKEKLLKNLDTAGALRMNSMGSAKRKLIQVENLTLAYGEKRLCENISFTVSTGERVVLKGRNGSGKTSIINAVLAERGSLMPGPEKPGPALRRTGSIWTAGDLEVSYLSQETSWLRGMLKDFAAESGIDMTLFLTVLKQLDFPRTQFEKEISRFSEGQKKKVLIARSLVKPANLFIWDEPLNYVDILSREQIEQLILEYKPAMLFVEHDAAFVEKIATNEILL